ncbi:Os06g0619132 [Oryza sativa Japonica Group]|uniref:Os06g0619132 protein n=1 Tax=Oryza sativa subsp. japonica TaxID=39947 RepID=A0A0P0WZ95_ORYSJ|nr:hypothetical protein EE612_035386 [Oryza sativa]BAS98646.1 Os06g0619132 [Oryza sativa Japonica Group]
MLILLMRQCTRRMVAAADRRSAEHARSMYGSGGALLRGLLVRTLISAFVITFLPCCPEPVSDAILVQRVASGSNSAATQKQSLKHMSAHRSSAVRSYITYGEAVQVVLGSLVIPNSAVLLTTSQLCGANSGRQPMYRSFVSTEE